MVGDAEGVRDAFAALDAAFDRRDLDSVLDLCTEDVLFIGSGDGEEAIGRYAIGPMFAGLSSRLDSVDFAVAWEDVSVEVIGDVALLNASGRATLVTPNRDDRFGYRLTGVLLLRDGRWLWRVYHGSEPGRW